jgi:hypothetical protein
VFGDCARELTLPIHPTVCFEAGWFTLTQNSWTRPGFVPANGCLATLLLRWRCLRSGTVQKHHLSNRLGKLIPPGRWKSPLSLDCYLSWMSPKKKNGHRKERTSVAFRLLLSRAEHPPPASGGERRYLQLPPTKRQRCRSATERDICGLMLSAIRSAASGIRAGSEIRQIKSAFPQKTCC